MNLNSLSLNDLVELDHDLQFIEYAEHPENFIFSGIVKTQDERDIHNPVKEFQDKEYLRAATREIFDSEILFIPKSRQLMLTWLLCAYSLWQALFHPHQKIFLQSKKEDDAASLVFNKKWDGGRIGFIYDRLPDWLKERVKGTGSFGKIHFNNGSMIWGVPQGSDIIRSYTASLFVSDEAAFQPEFESAYTAAKPMAKKIVAITTAGPGYFADIVSPVLSSAGV